MPELPSSHISSSTAIDVLIPAIEKDLNTLPYVIDGVRRFVRHPIGTVYIVSPGGSAGIRRLCASKGCKFVDEALVLPLSKKDIHYRSSRWERSGWLLQQLLKLSGDRICQRKHFLVIDADTVLIRPHTFLTKGKTVYYYRSWSQPEYFRTHRKLLGKGVSAPHSFVSHYMLFDRDKLSRLKRTIEDRHGIAWFKAILRSIDKTKQFGFSEFETYGNFHYAERPGEILFRHTLNKSLPLKASSLSAAKVRLLARKYRSLSFHQRKGYTRTPKE
ncbi:DUF6492 family protein [Paenibacillus gansuensis]|uniref:DUF6492 family protein n=1 Tax=Paenibacillus gansuensis TaxID=306542 RepID=A0ABW5P7S6_9BACL